MKLLLTMMTALAVAIHGLPHDECHYECPQFWLPYNGACYRYFGDRVPWEDALNRCRGHYSLNGRADLVSIHNAQENGFVYDLFRSSAGDTPPYTTSGAPYYGVWIGFYQLRAGSTGPFIWTDGSAGDDFSTWHTGQPSNSGNCAHIWRRNPSDDFVQAWNDLPCTSVLPFICKVAPN